MAGRESTSIGACEEVLTCPYSVVHVPLAARAIISQMPASTNERQALKRELAELPTHVANYQRELDTKPQDNNERRERLKWQIRRVRKRMAEIEARLSGGQT
jgi:chromosome segregation ATPase